MMTAAPVELPPLGSCSPCRSSGGGQRFYNLRGVRWRINLGMLPSSPSDSIEVLRRAAADSRRRYATLRRRLLTDPHTTNGNKSSDYVMDNPLSQNPESTWGRFFRNAELEKIVDQDLCRLYPEDGSYFQTPACQAMLRRVLLVWCLRHPECGYRQGMHELLAPLLYVLHVDLDYLSKVRGLYDDYFNNEFDGLSYPESELVYHYRVKKAKSWDLGGDDDDFYEANGHKITCFDDLDPDTRDVFLLSDAYGAEGELGVVISERFMEHDAYNLFNGLMGGSHGVLAMADFFSISPAIGSSMGIPPVIEASTALYHLLSIVDSSLHSHLVELGVEPQYFALRWLRVLFGREFSLDDLLVIWDELFSSPNDSCIENDEEYSFRVLLSPRGAFISAMAVSMLLHVRSSLLATENATSCLQRLLNFPRNIDVKKLIDKAKSYQEIAWESYIIGSSQASSIMNRSSEVKRTCSVSQNTPIRTLPDSYWEEKWQVLHKEEKLQKSDLSKGGKIKELLGRKLWLSRTKSDLFPAKNMIRKKQEQSSVRRKLLDDLAQILDFEGDAVQHILPGQGPPVNENVGKCSVEEPGNKNIIRTSEEPCYQNTTKTSDCIAEETYLRLENSSVLSMATGPCSEGNDTEIDSEKSSLTSNSFIVDNEDDNSHAEECNSAFDNSVPKDIEINAPRAKSGASEDLEEKGVPEMKERKSLSGKFQWFWRFGKGPGGKMERRAIAKAQRSSSFGNGSVSEGVLGSSASNCSSWGDSARIEVGDKEVIGMLKNLGQSMLENIQVIESVFQQERGQAANILGGKGQTTAMAALKELRKVSNLLSEM